MAAAVSASRQQARGGQKCKVNMLQNFVAFSEYMKFKTKSMYFRSSNYFSEIFISYLLILQSSDGGGVSFKAASKGNSANRVLNRQASV